MHRPLARRLTGAALTLLATVGAVLSAPAPAQAAGESYVALGDSYSAGNGTREKLDDCWRSSLAYPSLLAAQRGYALDLRACSGATVADVSAVQLDALSADTDLVSISVGGNDAGFADVLTECALPGWASDCDEAIDGAQAHIADQLPGSLSGLYAAIRSRAPYAQVVVVGYPRIFMGEDCNALTFFSPEEEARLNQTADQVNATTRAAATAAGFGFADPTSAFTGHAVCDDPEWINGLSDPIDDSYHPNAAGHAGGYAPTVGAVLGGSFAATPALLEAARAQGPAIAASQAEHAAADATIEPEVVEAPDLRSPEVRAAAKAHGIDLERWLRRHA